MMRHEQWKKPAKFRLGSDKDTPRNRMSLLADLQIKQQPFFWFSSLLTTLAKFTHKMFVAQRPKSQKYWTRIT